jgi:endonuclease YncB( thermonuclease family)
MMRVLTGMGDNLFRALIVFLVLSAIPANAQVITGQPRIVDGDTIVIVGTRVRLHGIDAPEKKQAGGREASAGLAKLIADREVWCEQTDTDRRGRAVAICKVEARDLGAAMVSDGFAWAYLRYSHDYLALEREARRSRVGIWQTEQVLGFRSVVGPQPPWEYRAEQRRGLLRWFRATVGELMEWLRGDELGI